jgi:tRNA-intron endonuclease
MATEEAKVEKQRRRSDRAKYKPSPIHADFLSIHRIRCQYDGVRFEVEDVDDIERLWFGGSFGKGSYSRSQPTRLRDVECQPPERLLLTVYEVLYLKMRYDCLELWSVDALISLDELWQRTTTGDPGLMAKFGAYSYYRDQGLIVRLGTSFGCDFVLYRLGPALDHAFAGVSVLESANCSWSEIIGTARILNSVKKYLIITEVSLPGKETHTDLTTFMTAVTVREIPLRRWKPEKTRD